MKTNLESLAQSSGPILLALIVAVVGLLILVVRLTLRERATSKKWSELLDGVESKNLDMVLSDHLRERIRLESRVLELEARATELEKKMTTSKRFVGLVRYDAFEDVGGSQSFALAMYDDNGNGAIVSSLIGRSDCRVYCKPLVSGRSDRDLSQEEQRAMRDAISSSPKALVGP